MRHVTKIEKRSVGSAFLAYWSEIPLAKTLLFVCGMECHDIDLPQNDYRRQDNAGNGTRR